MKQARQSSIELLRIIALSMVVFMHYFYEIKGVVGHGFIYHSLLFANSSCVCAVDLFLIITGFFTYSSDKRSIGKVLDLIFQVSFYNLLFLFFFGIIGIESLSFRSIIAAAVPASYFVILYIALYLVSPYINFMIRGLNNKGKKNLLVIILIVFSIYPTVVDLFGEVVKVDWWGLSSIGAWGSQQGFNIVNFMLCYIIGALIKDNEQTIMTWIKQFKTRILYIYILNIFVIFGWAVLCDYLDLHGMRSSWVYHNPLVILNAVLLFLLFYGIKFQSSFINSIATASFTLFIIHTKILHKIDIVNYILTNGAIAIVLSFIIFLIFVWLLSWLLAGCYKHSIGHLFGKLKNHLIHYSI